MPLPLRVWDKIPEWSIRKGLSARAEEVQLLRCVHVYAKDKHLKSFMHSRLSVCSPNTVNRTQIGFTPETEQGARDFVLQMWVLCSEAVCLAFTTGSSFYDHNWDKAATEHRPLALVHHPPVKQTDAVQQWTLLISTININRSLILSSCLTHLRNYLCNQFPHCILR